MLSEKNIPFTFEDISTSMVSLKSYLLLRDTNAAFRAVRGTQKVGIPLLVVDGDAYIVETTEAIREVIETLHLADA